MSYVDKVRTYQKEMSLDEAVDRAVNECIAEGVLADFLRANKAEVMNMSIYEYDEELHIKTMMDIGREEGYEAGVSEGLETGRREGLETGRREGINGAISIMKNMNTSDEDIIKNIVDTFDMTKDEALTYLFR